MKVMKIVVPITILIVGYLGMKGIEASASDNTEQEEVDTRPTVTIESLLPENVTVSLSSYGEVMPLESTNLAAQVSGEVQSWNPNFVSGGLIRRGEVLFSIEKDTYEAALLLAEANLASAKAQLIQEEAQADVALRESKSLPASSVTDLYLRKPQVLSAQAAVKSAQAQLRIAQRDLANCDVKAPYDALIIERNISTGDYLNTGAVAAVINNVEYAEITFPVAGFDRGFMNENPIGDKATIVLDSQSNFTVEGTIHRDTGIVDSATRMSQFVARIDDPYALNSDKPVVKFGSYATVEYKGRTLQEVYRIPQDLITQKIVWTLDGDSKLISQPIDVIREEGSDFLIRGNFDASRVVVSLPEYPRNGMDVRLLTSEELVANRTLGQ